MDPTVRTKQGLTEGLKEEEIFKFLGVPYAEPPVTERRWRPPVPVAWARVRKAQDFGPICPQARYSKHEPRARVKIACT
jgi:para-nitrobenzyl esterase